jgi:hypothetical protein
MLATILFFCSSPIFFYYYFLKVLSITKKIGFTTKQKANRGGLLTTDPNEIDNNETINIKEAIGLIMILRNQKRSGPINLRQKPRKARIKRLNYQNKGHGYEYDYYETLQPYWNPR